MLVVELLIFHFILAMFAQFNRVIVLCCKRNMTGITRYHACWTRVKKPCPSWRRVFSTFSIPKISTFTYTYWDRLPREQQKEQHIHSIKQQTLHRGTFSPLSTTSLILENNYRGSPSQKIREGFVSLYFRIIEWKWIMDVDGEEIQIEAPECGTKRPEQCCFSQVTQKLLQLSEGICRELFLSRGSFATLTLG